MRKTRHLFVSNRSPYLFHETGSKLKSSIAIGGLVSTMEPAFRKLGGLWIASSDGLNKNTRQIALYESSPNCFCKPVNLSDNEINLYYNGFANGSLWPLCHFFGEKCRFKLDEWIAYRNVNMKFARAISEELSSLNDVVWIHDYHLALTPKFVRNQTKGVKIACFWHIPFPSPDIFLKLPWCKEVLTGLLHSDFLGFHLEAYADNFLLTVQREFPNAEFDRDRSSIRVDGLETLIRAIPLGIDFNYWDQEVRRNSARKESRNLRASLKVENIALSVDRLDYTKGIIERIIAIEKLFRRNPHLKKRFCLLQIGVPTRTGMKVYRDYQASVEGEIARVNARFGCDNWLPIVFKKGMVSQRHLAAIYSEADIACVTPLRDGMNLVAKEYVASQVDLKGALVLSRFAGAAEDLADCAELVNPNIPDEITKAIERTLALGTFQKKAKMARMRAKVRERNLSWWLDSISAYINAKKKVEIASAQNPHWGIEGGALSGLGTSIPAN